MSETFNIFNLPEEYQIKTTYDTDFFGYGRGVEPDGVALYGSRVNEEFVPFEQETIAASIYDVLGSAIRSTAQVFGRDLGQKAGDALGPAIQDATTKGFFESFFQQFQSTKTGQQIESEAINAKLLSYAKSPVVWISVVLLVTGLFLVARK